MRDATVLTALLVSLAACSQRAATASLPAPPASASAPVALEVPLETASATVEPATTAPPSSASAAATPIADAGPSEPRPCPEGMALVQRFCIDRFEADLVSPDADGGLAKFPPNQRPATGVRFAARSVPGVLPQAYISRVEAAAACANAGKRLCSMKEWRRTCEGQLRTKYPYGEHHVAGVCNNEKGHLLSIRYGSNPSHWKYENFNDPSLDATPGFLARTGEYEGCTTPEGVHDLVGNLHEWVSDMVDADLVEKLEAEEVERHNQPWKEGNGVFMGGFFSTADQHGPGCMFTTIAHEPTYHDYSIGFRCCASADLPAPSRKAPRRGPR
jgi:formylglycine-generating enzyme